MTNVLETSRACETSALNTYLAPDQQLKQGNVLCPDSPLHYLLPLCRPQLRQLLKHGSHHSDITRLQNSTKRSVKQINFSQGLLTNSLAQPMIKRLITHIRVSSHEFQSPYLIDFRECLNVGGLWLICTDAEQHFVWKHTKRRGF
ncbi:hypothetical protein FM038_017325 [Shewanella eurypsychrophilus]|uniref:Orphan protein n=1 Tax=Shewanella eurypsychrophilus TaxID=2593656 RepID=A0ABX6VAD5_9GAMM|nr:MULTISPECIES: hypothetical protein [Shewanella]QFU23759.1 hypothetical protein FS418_19105 [Shewanella sp. YLB-09]QPG58982.1 hypothetical protein FM038_017325 [Shewanella eurypsychrophilus]